MYVTLAFFVSFFLSLTCGCDKNPAKPEVPDYAQITQIRYSEHVQVLFDNNCTACHSTGVDSAGLKLDSWDHLIKGSRYGEVVIPFDAENSVLTEMLTKLTAGSHPAERGGSALAADAIDFLKRWIDTGAKNDAGMAPYATSDNLLYVCNQDAAMISVIDTDALVVIRTVALTDLGYPLTAKPHHIAVEPTGQFWYVSLLGANKILKFDRNNNIIAEVSISIPALIAAHPSNGKLYVSRFPQAPGGDEPSIGVVDRDGMTLMPDIPVRPTPHAIAGDRGGNYIYTCSLSASELIVIDAGLDEVVSIVPLGIAKGPLQLAVSPDDSTLYISNQVSDEMIVVDVSKTSARPIVGFIPVADDPWHPAYLPDGSRVYVGNNNAHLVTVLDANAHEVIAEIGRGDGQDGLAQPHGLAVSRDGRRVFVSGQNVMRLYTPRHDFGDNQTAGTVVVIDTQTEQIVKVLEVEDFASGLTIGAL